MNTKNFHIHLSPDPLNGGEGGGAGSSGPLAAPAPAFDPVAYKTEFETRLTSEIDRVNGEWESKYSELEGRLPKPAKAEPSEDKEPDAESGEYDFNKKGEFQRYQRDLAKFHLGQEFKTREASYREQSEAQEREQRVQEITAEANSRDQAYKAAHPEYEADLRNADLKFHRKVGLTIQDSDYSAEIKHFLAKNPAKVAELRAIANKSRMGVDAAVRYVGRLEAQFETKAAPAMPQGKPTRPAFGGTPAKTPSRNTEEIVKDWRM